MVETGVEPAKSLGSRPSRFSGLRTQPYKWRVQESHLAVRAYEAQMSTSPPAVASPGIEPGYRPYESQLNTNRPAMEKVTMRRFELLCLWARRSERRMSTNFITSCFKVVRSRISEGQLV